MMAEILKFDLPKNQSSIIKVMGVGGGGSNAVNHMFREGIKGVDFIICNTDAQAMESSPVPVKIQLGANLTAGLGAGAAPSVGRNAALENSEDIRAVLEKGTKMLFITAGLGGGTGTGAAPVIAQISRELDILTVGIVTIPFNFEGRKRKQSAEEGIRQLKQNVDALLIISNDKLRLLCGDLPLSEAFKRADNVLTTAAKGIAEIITVTGYINVDFEDVKTVMKNSGVAIMGTGVAVGPNRAQLAVEEALSSPLLDNNDIEGAGNLLLYISSGKNEITMDEVTEITDFIQSKTKSTAEVIWGNGYEESLEDKISVTIIATGFDEDHKQKDPSKPVDFTVHNLYPEVQTPKVEKRIIPVEPEIPFFSPEPESILPVNTLPEIEMVSPEPQPEAAEPLRTFEFNLDFPKSEILPEPTPALVHEFEPADQLKETEPVINIVPRTVSPETISTEPDANDSQNRKTYERISKLRALSEKLKNLTPIENNLYELESVPAYKRRNIELNETTPSSESQVAKFMVSDNPDNAIENRRENSFLHKKLD
ncbi:MAG TPA: cell division protein FtsZ [Bacteroidales bacterium]|nr:cell division protein FtsZ [Bacteroidales bacterium]HPT10814.1 cell division protein FtsZ [Bacteroidales bacterium]